MSVSPKILITGASGQVGGALVRALKPHTAFLGEVHAPGRAELDLTDSTSIRAAVRFLRPRWILNPAAYTAVDKAESEPALAHQVNAEAPRILGEEARRIGATVVHFSTDYVFDGSGTHPWREGDPTGPLGVYGATKLAGEQALAATEASHLILRTSWVYAPAGKNFLLTVLRIARERGAALARGEHPDPLRIVDDQTGAPTAAADLARLVTHIMTQCETESSERHLHLASVLAATGGILHATSQGETTWFGFASEALRAFAAAHPGVPLCAVEPIPSSAYPTPARRPGNSRLDCERLYTAFGFRLPPWQVALAHVLAELPEANRHG